MRLLAIPLACALASIGLTAASSDKNLDEKKPQVSIKATPSMAFSPARIVVTVDIKGGPNDFEDFYCPETEWEWGDGTTSNESADCDPYQPGKSEIKRHFAVTHVFSTAGDYRVQFRMKKKDRVVGTVNTVIKVRCGLGDNTDGCGW